MIDILVDERAWTAAEPRAVALTRLAASATLAAEGRQRARLAILLASDARLTALNAQFRGRQGPTNVLSFGGGRPGAIHLGDVALAFGVCVREAAEQGKPLAHHLQHLVAHGVLHLLGYDHESEVEADLMEAKERAILAGLGVPDPYAERGAQGDHG